MVENHSNTAGREELGSKFVRPGRVEDAFFVAQLQASNTLELLTEAFPGTDWSPTISADLLKVPWEGSLAKPSDSVQGTLIADDNGNPVGFGAYQTVPPPAEIFKEIKDQMGAPIEILALEIAVTHRRRGHASRLLSAISDVARENQKQHLLVWLVPEDEARTRFFQSAGFGPVGLRRDLTTPRGSLTQHLWFTNLE